MFGCKGGKKQNSWKESRRKRRRRKRIYEITLARFIEYLDIRPIILIFVTREWADICSIIQYWSFTQPFAHAKRK